MSETDAKIGQAKAELQGDFRVAISEVVGEIRAIAAKSDERFEHLNYRLERSEQAGRTTAWTLGSITVASAIGIIGTIVAIYGFGSQMFSVGLSVKTITSQETNEAAEKAAKRAVEEIKKAFPQLAPAVEPAPNPQKSGMADPGPRTTGSSSITPLYMPTAEELAEFQVSLSPNVKSILDVLEFSQKLKKIPDDRRVNYVVNNILRDKQRLTVSDMLAQKQIILGLATQLDQDN